MFKSSENEVQKIKPQKEKYIIRAKEARGENECTIRASQRRSKCHGREILAEADPNVFSPLYVM